VNYGHDSVVNQIALDIRFSGFVLISHIFAHSQLPSAAVILLRASVQHDL